MIQNLILEFFFWQYYLEYNFFILVDIFQWASSDIFFNIKFSSRNLKASNN